MPLPVIADTCRVAILWRNDVAGLNAVNVMHFSCDPTDTAGLLAALDANTQPHQFEGLSADTVAAEAIATPLDGTSASHSGVLTTWVGSSGAVQVIPASAIVVSEHTARRGRSYRGRVYLPFTAEIVQDGGLLPDANAGEIEDDWNAFGAAMDGDGYTPLVASYLHSTSEPITTYSVSTILGTMRRRQDQLR